MQTIFLSYCAKGARLAQKTQSGVLCWAIASVSSKHTRRVMYFLSKTVGRLVEPIGIIWLVLLIACGRAILKKDRQQAIFTGALALFITLIGSTKLPAYLLSTLEKPYAIENFSTLPECDVVVLLGGGHSYVSNEPFNIEFHDAADRIVIAAELVRLGKGRALVIGGGEYSSGGSPRPEGELLQNWLETWRPFTQPIYILEKNQHTRNEAVNTAALAKEHGWKKIILVTSAWHMRRSEALYKEVGLEVIPAGSDFAGTSALETNWTFYPVPIDSGFRHLALYLHEQVGWLYYKLRGWI